MRTLAKNPRRSKVPTARIALNEDHSEEAAAFIEERIPVSISTLTVVEMRSLLGRRRRAREIRPEIELRILATLEDDQRRGALVRLPVNDEALLGAATLLATLPPFPPDSTPLLTRATSGG